MRDECKRNNARGRCGRLFGGCGCGDRDAFCHNTFLEFRTKLNAGTVESVNDTFTIALGTNESTESNGITRVTYQVENFDNVEIAAFLSNTGSEGGPWKPSRTAAVASLKDFALNAGVGVDRRAKVSEIVVVVGGGSAISTSLFSTDRFLRASPLSKHEISP